jgi:hypothetical protein
MEHFLLSLKLTHVFAKVITGVKFKDGIEATKPSQIAA